MTIKYKKLSKMNSMKNLQIAGLHVNMTL